MKNALLIAAAFLVMALGLIASPAAQARVFVGVGYGGCCGYYGGGAYPYYPYPAYYYPYAVAPPPVVYAVPPASPVVYGAPPAPAPAPAPAQVVASPGYAAPTYAAPAPVPAPAAAAPQSSPTFIDSEGRTCRHYEATTAGGAPTGTACLQQDGTWRVVQ